MISIKRDELKTVQQQIKEKLNTQSEVALSFEVVPLDHQVRNSTTPTLLIIDRTMVFTYDDVIEFYELDNLNIELLGARPHFQLWRNLFESYQPYTDETAPVLIKNARDNEFTTRLAINEPQKVPFEFILRRDILVQKPYLTWAMYQTLLNYKNGLRKDENLEKFFVGNFNTFNQRTVLLFIAIFAGYFLIRVLLGGFLPQILQTILDIIFGLVSLLMGIWTYLSVQGNLDKHKITYDKYRTDESEVKSS